MPCAAPRPRARRSLHKRPAGQPAAAANSLKARPCPDRAPRRARSQTRTRVHDGCRGLRLQARARCGCQKFAGHQSELGLGATPARRLGVPGALGVPRDALSLGPLRLRFEFESWAPLQASRDGPAEASRRGSRTTARVLEGYLAAVAVPTRIVERGHGCRVDTPSCSRAPAVRARGRAGRA